MPTVFVYGTLTDPATASVVLPAFEFGERATLAGLHRVDGRYPTLAPGGETRGRLLRTDDLDALDAYEGVDRGLYARVSLPLAGTGGEDDDTVQTYVGDPARLDVEASWPGDEDFPACVRSYVCSHDVRVAAGDGAADGP